MNKLLQDLSVLLQEHGKTLTNFGFPESESIDTELQRHALKYVPAEQAVEYETQQKEKPNNFEQDRYLEKLYRVLTRVKQQSTLSRERVINPPLRKRLFAILE